MENSFKIFYSWQSDRDKQLNNFHIKWAINKAIKELNKDAVLELELSLEKDTTGNPGSPNIIETIFKKIDACDLFICDVTLINRKRIFPPYHRLTPNPNVLIELGYAVKTLGWDRILCISNTAFGSIEDLPFDIRQNRILTYQLKKSPKDKSESRKKLKDIIKLGIRSIIENYEEISNAHNYSGVQGHDIKIFNAIMKICEEKKFYEIVDSIISYRRVFSSQYSIMDQIEEFYIEEGNRFINEKLNDVFKILVSAISKFENHCSTVMFSDREDRDYGTFERNGVVLSNGIYRMPKEPRYEDYDSFINRIDEQARVLLELGNNVKKSFRNFRSLVKKELII